MKNKREPRIIALLSHVMMEYYINEILIIRRQLKNHNEKVDFDKKLLRLKQQLEVDSKLVNDINKLYDVRNAYAHLMDVNEKFVDGKLNSIKSFPSIKLPKNTKQKYLKVVELVMTKLAGKYMAVLVREAQRYDRTKHQHKAWKKHPIFKKWQILCLNWKKSDRL